jgi:hypothetical protein
MKLEWRYASNRRYDPEDFRCSYNELIRLHREGWKIPSRAEFLHLIDNNNLLEKIPIYNEDHGVSYWTCDHLTGFNIFDRTKYTMYYTVNFSYYDCDKIIQLVPQRIQEKCYVILCKTI